jgi:hypothetical protein
VAEDCIFCKIVAGELPAERVREDEHTVAFMDLNPWTRGHALVIPRRHSKNLYEVPEEDLRHTAAAAKQLAERMRDQPPQRVRARGLADRLPLPHPRDPALCRRSAPPARAPAAGLTRGIGRCRG